MKKVIRINNDKEAIKFCNICMKYKEFLNVNLICGSRIVDGCSIVGVLGMMLKKCILDIHCSDENVVKDFYDELLFFDDYTEENE